MSKAKAFEYDIENPKTKKSAILYYDICGYKQLIGNDPQLFHKRIDSIVRLALKGKLYKYKIFSDNFLTSLPMVVHHAHTVMCMVQEAAFRQWLLLSSEILIRGAIVYGDIYNSADYVFGTGLIEAVEIESSTSNPKIVISENGCKIIKDRIEYMSDSQIDTSLFLADNTGVTFVNYLSDMLNHHNYSGDEKGVDFYLAQYKTFIEKNLNSDLDEKATDKYQWTADYYNYFITKNSLNKDFLIEISPKYSFEDVKF